MDSSNRFGQPRPGSGSHVTGRGRALGAVVVVMVVVLGYLAYIAISNKVHSQVASTSSGMSSSGTGPSTNSAPNPSSAESGPGPFAGLMGRFGGSKPDVTICAVTWPGYVGPEYFNGGFKASKEPRRYQGVDLQGQKYDFTLESRYWKEYGITVEIKIIDDFLASRQAWQADQCDVQWITADSFVAESASLKKFNPKIFFQADWSRGGDVALAKNEIKNGQGLRGKKVSFAVGTPSETLLLTLLEASNLNMGDIIPKKVGNATDSASMFKSGNVDAAIVWSPDDQDCLTSVPGSHVLLSSRQASSIIADVFYAKQEWLDSHHKEAVALVKGWLEGSAEINSNAEAKYRAVKMLAANFQGVDLAYCEKTIDNARRVTYGDNLNFFGLNPSYSGVMGKDLYEKMAGMYAAVGDAPPMVPNWRSVTDLSVLKDVQLVAEGSQAAENAPKFAAPTPDLATAPEVASKPLTVQFATGSAMLDSNAKLVIDLGFAQTARLFRDEHVRIEGNTDRTGNPGRNVALSQRRARAVADYLVSKYSFDPNRFIVVGNGPDKPVCEDDTPECYAQNRRTDFQLVN